MTELEPHFKFLYGQFNDVYTGYSSYVFTTSATILLVMNWLLTSEDARSYIADHQWIRVAFTIAIAFFLAAEVWLSYGALKHSQEIVALIASVFSRGSSTHSSRRAFAQGDERRVEPKWEAGASSSATSLRRFGTRRSSKRPTTTDNRQLLTSN